MLDTPAPSGFEGPAARVWREEASTFADKVTTDVAGNSMAEINPGGSPTIMLDGHIDEIGLIVQYIDDDGYVYPSPIGGWDPQVLVGQRIRFLGRGGDVARRRRQEADPSHEDRRPRSRVEDDRPLGRHRRVEPRRSRRRGSSVGDPGVIDSKTIDFPNNRIVSRSIDDRIGAFVVLEALRRYAAEARSGARRRRGDDAGGDRLARRRRARLHELHQPADGDRRRRHLRHRPSEHREEGDRRPSHRRRSGAEPRRRSSRRSSSTLLRTAADATRIKYSVHAAGRDTSTNADAIHIAREGVATGLVSIPNRYMHSPERAREPRGRRQTATLLAEVCREVNDKTDFRAR